jgi:hypothetical protein
VRDGGSLLLQGGGPNIEENRSEPAFEIIFFGSYVACVWNTTKPEARDSGSKRSRNFSARVSPPAALLSHAHPQKI